MRAQLHDDLSLAGIERGLQSMRRVAAVLDRVALAPFADYQLAHAEGLREFGLGAVGPLDRQARGRRRRGVLVQLDQHPGLPFFKSASRPLKTSRPTRIAADFQGVIHPGHDSYTRPQTVRLRIEILAVNPISHVQQDLPLADKQVMNICSVTYIT